MKGLDRVSHAVRVGRRFWPEVREHRGRLALLATTALFAVGFEILRPWPLQWIFDRALVPTGPVSYTPGFVIASGAAAVLVIALARTALEYFTTLRLTEVGHAVTRNLRLRIFRHMAELSPFFHARHPSGDLLMRLMGDVPMVRTMLVDASVQVLARSVLIVGTITVMLVMDPLLTLVALVPLPLLFWAVRVMSARLTIAVRKQRRKEGELAGFLHEALGASTTIQSLGQSQHAVRRFARENRRSVRAGLKTARAAARLSASVETLLGAVIAATLGAGGWRVVGGHLSAGELLVFVSYVRGLLKPIRSMGRHMVKIAKGTACGERILEVLDEAQEVRETAGDLSAPMQPQVLSFEGVSFRYPDGTSALSKIDLQLRRGELVALSGPSGAGKSTVTSLALRLFDPTEGAVRLDGVSARDYDLDSLRGCFALAMQDTVLFGESIRENLWFGKPDASDEELAAALRAAGADRFVAELPEGLDTELGADGVGLSGGQAHRICLARTLLRDAPILIVDEPFQGLDSAAADLLEETLRERARSRLVLVITHDIARLERFDRVVRLEEGHIIADERRTATGSDASPSPRSVSLP